MTTLNERNDEAAAISTASRATISGRVTDCGRPAEGYEVVASEITEIGFQIPRKPCRVSTNTRTVGSTTIGADGSFAIAFTPTPERDEFCTFRSTCRIDVFEGATRRWRSPQRPSAGTIRFDHELEPGCPPGSTRVEVRDQRNNTIAGAEVFVDGELRGTTDRHGRLVLEPAVDAGAELVARRRVHEEPTPRGGHDQDSDQNWSYRVYETTLDLIFDRENGDDPRFLADTVDDPLEPQTVHLTITNALVALNLRASIEWDATDVELRRYRDRLTDMSELLFNATDGQFLVEHLTVADRGDGWDDADVRIYASLNTPSHAAAPGIFDDRGWIHMNPNDAHFSGTLLHELGHYAFGVLDEYKHGPDSDRDISPYCTLRTGEGSGPFADGGRKNSCLMRGNRFENRSKFCSAHPLNVHNPNNMQGEQACWSEILARYNRRPVHLRTPDERGAIISHLPDTGIPLGSDTAPPARMTPAPSVIPLQDWKTTWHLRTRRPDPCPEPVVVQVRLDGQPADGAVVTLEHDGRHIEQGRTQAYELVYGVITQQGEVPLRGGHVGDGLHAFLQDAGDGSPAEGRATVASCTETAVIDLERRGARPRIDVEPREPGRVFVRTTVAAGARAASRVDAEVEGVPHVLRIPLGTGESRRDAHEVAGDVSGLPLTGRATFRIRGGEERDEGVIGARAAFAGAVVDERIRLQAPDGRLELFLGEGTNEPPTQVLVQATAVPAPDTSLLSGPYRLAQWPVRELRRPAVLTFELPTSEEAVVRNRTERLAILRWDGGEWAPVPGHVAPERPAATAVIDMLGTYALALR